MANLISNAIKYSESGGSVTLSLRRQHDFYRVDVSDEGTGIPPEFHSRIFERFSQADSSDTRRRGGTGLGLAISRSIIESHQGEIDFFSTLGQGSTFYFKLPVSMPMENPAPAPLSAKGHTPSSKYQVLYIDGEKSLFYDINNHLSDFCKLLYVSSKGAASLALNNQAFDLVIMDWQLKGEDISPLIGTTIDAPTKVIILGNEMPDFRPPNCVAATHLKSRLNISALKSEVRLILKNRNTREAM
ncbi:sensor histidine kinase [Enterovibrio coralii]|uniref:sensor histidine kinase n=1 Tax=Enterovibrio coralii TaxID=294935 RepID=UPI001E46E5CE|nr:ATP-binding protein [Enterovibrio coralii]